MGERHPFDRPDVGETSHLWSRRTSLPWGVTWTCQSTGTERAARTVRAAWLWVTNAPSDATKAIARAMLTAATSSSSGRRRSSPANQRMVLMRDPTVTASDRRRRRSVGRTGRRARGRGWRGPERPRGSDPVAQGQRDLVGVGAVEGAGRLVGQHQAVPAGQGAGDRDALLLAAGELGRQRVGEVCGRHSGERQQAADAAPPRRRHRAAGAGG